MRRAATDGRQDDRLRPRKKKLRGPADGLVLEHGEDENQRRADEIADVSGQRPGSVFVVGAVQKDDRTAADGFQPARPFAAASPERIVRRAIGSSTQPSVRAAAMATAAFSP